MNPSSTSVGLLLLIATILLAVLVILWITFPFAVFGTKPRLDEINRNLEEIRGELQAIREFFLALQKRKRGENVNLKGK